MINLLFLIDGLNPGGAERQLNYLIRNLDPCRFNISLITWYPSTFYMDIGDQKNIYWKEIIRVGKFDSRPIKGILSMIQENKIDIIHSYLDTACLYGAIAKVLNRKVKFIATERSSFKVLNLLQKVHKPISHRIADLTITNSKKAIMYLLDLGVKKDKMKFIWNGIDTSRYRNIQVGALEKFRADKLLPDGKFLLYVGRITFLKNQLGVLKAYSNSKITETHKLVFFGDTDESYIQMIQRYIHENNLKELVFVHEAVSNVELLYLLSDVVILFSDYEGTPNVVMEAMAAAKPVITSKVGDVEMFVDHSNGWIVSPRDEASLAFVFDSVSDSGFEKLEQMGINGRLKIESLGCTIESMVAKHTEVYESMISQQ